MGYGGGRERGKELGRGFVGGSAAMWVGVGRWHPPLPSMLLAMRYAVRGTEIGDQVAAFKRDPKGGTNTKARAG
eukprot:3941908-Rhodomonas_salina.4